VETLIRIDHPPPYTLVTTPLFYLKFFVFKNIRSSNAVGCGLF
jgi:hypothetical protein